MQKEAMFYTKKNGGTVECFLCPHNCTITESHFGICNVRQNIGGTLYTRAYGNPVTRNVDPIEKKPLYHFLPGTLAYSIATMGCNFTCGFCQNWRISQIEKEERESYGKGNNLRSYPPEEIVSNALRSSCSSIAYTYTEPTIFFEYAYDISIQAADNNVKNIFVTNGYISEEALETVSPYLDAANVDLKSFSDDYYKKICKARLQPVLDTIRRMKEKGIWIEVTTLVVPGQNDSEEELNEIAHFIADTGTGIPWHISRFYPQFQYRNTGPTPIETLKRARELGEKAGIRHIHLGNV